MGEVEGMETCSVRRIRLSCCQGIGLFLCRVLLCDMDGSRHKQVLFSLRGKGELDAGFCGDWKVNLRSDASQYVSSLRQRFYMLIPISSEL